MHIIFIHGKESDPKNSSKAQAIRDRFPESIVSVPDYKPKERSYEEIDEFFREYFDRMTYLDDEELFIIGSSLGGYWALKWASPLDASGCILINPDLNYYGKLPTLEPSLPVTLLVCKDDTVVDHNFAVNLFTGQRNGVIVIYETGGHQMEDTEDMLGEIEEAIHSHWDRGDI
jgi:dienelactone hydrolase